MQLTHSQVKAVLSPLYGQASQNEAIDMREFAGLMEGLREAIAERDAYESLTLLNISRSRYDNDTYRPYLLSFRKAIEERLFAACASRVREMKAAGDPYYFDCWLNEYADSLANWLGRIYDPLCTEDFGFTGEQKEWQDDLALFNRYLTDGKWVETYPYFKKLAADERITPRVRSTMEATAGLVCLYWLPNVETSLSHFDRAQEIDHTNYFPHRCVGEYNLKKLNFEAARSCFLNAVSVQPNDPANYLLVGDSYRDERKHSVAERWYLDAYNRNFLYPNAYNKLIELFAYEEYTPGEGISLEGWIEKSAKAIQDTEYDNERYENLRAIGSVYGRRGYREDARRYYNEAIALHPELTGARLDKAYSLGDENKLAEAEDIFLQALKNENGLEAGNADVYWGLGWLCEKKEDYTGAIDYYTKCLAARPAWKEHVCNLKGNLFLKLNDFRAAVECYGEAFELNPLEQLYLDNLRDALSKLGDEEKEFHYLRKAAELVPHGAENHNRLGIYYYKKGLFAEAINCYTTTIELVPDKAVYFENRALAWEKSGDLEKALADYQKAYELGKDAAMANKLGVLLFDQKDYPQAIRYYQQALEADGNNALYHGNLALALEYNNQTNEALEEYKKAISLDGGNGQYQNRIGLIYFKRQDFAHAKTWYNQALRLDPENSVYLENLAMVHSNLEEWEAAERVFETLVRKQPDEYLVCRLAEMNIRLQHYDQALENIDKALAFNPGMTEYLSSKAVLLEKQKRYAEAIPVYEKLVAANPESDGYINSLGLMHYYIGTIEHLQQATVYYQQAIAKKPLAVYYQNLGLACELLSNYEAAEKAFLQSVKLEPDNHTNLNHIGVFYHIRLGNPAQGAKFYKEAISLHDTDAIYYQNLGLASQDLGAYMDARKAYEKSLALAPDDPENHFGTGSFYFKTGIYEKALGYFQTAVALNPDNEIYQQALDECLQHSSGEGKVHSQNSGSQQEEAGTK